jgi:hypothetical protein
MLTALSAAAMAQTRPTVLQLEARSSSAIYLDEGLYFQSFREVDGLAAQVTSLLLGGGARQAFWAAPVMLSAGHLHWHDPVGYALARSGPAFVRGAAAQDWRPFDIAILTDCGDCPDEPRAKAAWLERSRRDAASVRRHGGHPVLFWPGPSATAPRRSAASRRRRRWRRMPAAPLSSRRGWPLPRARDLRPDLVLHADHMRPNRAGTYLAAVVTYAVLFGVSPVGNRAIADLEAATALFLQRVAWETALVYFAGKPPPD